ncbi:MAG TPA: PEP/pyruvate-binding domain-containing protein [Candidatus Dojkabacteria bacterium]|nr:PEP/pyruvate-binding domain-containing protein [Candidatus Dojkabacteria bacterium]
MSNETSKKPKVFFFEDYSAKELNENKVGRKGLSLFKLKDMDVPVPEFFVVSSDVFVEHSLKVFKGNKEKLLGKGKNPEAFEIESMMVNEILDKEAQEEILSAYTRLSGFTDAWVSVRSSVVFPNDKDVSFTGIFSTELNVRKYDELLPSIKRIFSSMFSDDVVAYAKRMNIDISDVKMAVVVQKMVQSEVAGIVYTVDPISQEKTKLNIEAVYGLGDVISLGEVTPDTYLLNKKDLSTVEKHIAPQEWMKVRTMKQVKKMNQGVEKIKISKGWSHKQKLSDKDIQEISKISLVIEDRSGEAQNIEWVLSGGRFWVLQNKPVRFKSLDFEVQSEFVVNVRSNVREEILGFIEKFESKDQMISSAMTEAKKIVQKNNDEEIKRLEELIVQAKKELDVELNKPETKREDFVISGIGASFGTVTGKINIVDGPVVKKYTKGDILLIKRYSSEMEGMILSSGGIIMETGGLTSDTAILCREFKIPAVVGAATASSLIEDGDIVKLDGNSGTIYKSSKLIDEIKKELHPIADVYARGDVTLKDLSDEEGDNTSSPPKDFTLPPTATKIFSLVDQQPKELFDFVGNSNGLVYIDLDKIMIEDGRHILQYVEDKKFVDYSKRICNTILEYVNLVKGDEVIISIGSAKVKDFRGLVGGKKNEDESLSSDAFGAIHYANNPELLKRVARIIRKLRNVYKKRNISLAVHAPMNEDVVREIKKLLLSEKLRRMSSFNLYVILDNPSEIILVDEIVNTNLDGVILNTPRVAKQMQGFKVDEKDAKYDLARSSIFKVLDNINYSVKGKTGKVIVIVENSKPLLKYCVQAGVYGVCVSPEDISDARRIVADEEGKIILGK